MALLPIIILALVQGITEFLPISSSGHLQLVHAYFEKSGIDPTTQWQNHMLLDTAVHLGTLLSVLLYFHRDIIKMLCGLKSVAAGNMHAEGSRLIGHILLASIPVILAGFVMYVYQPSWILKVEVVAWTTIIFGILLGFSDKYPKKEKTLENMSCLDALYIGLSQVLALVPGTSRSGITMTTARFLGYSRQEAAHFSLLLAIIAISGAGALGLKNLMESADITLSIDFFIAALISFLTGWIAIALMMKWLEKSSFMPFVIYRMILGSALLFLIYSGYIQ